MPTSNDRGGPLPDEDDHPYPDAALREIRKSDNDQMVLVPREEWDHLRASQMANLPPAAPGVLLPFSWKELAARLCEFVRDPGISAEGQLFRFGDVCVDFARTKVSRASSGESIPLTSQEFKTLRCFLLNPDRVLSRDELLNDAWGYESYPSTRTVDNHILKLRQKLEQHPARPAHFRTVYGIGYKFVP